MLIEFSLQNYKSFKNLKVLSLLENPIKPRYKWLEANSFQANDEYRLLKSKAIYGSNASGKSNLIKALAAFIYITRNSLKDERALRKIEPFLLSKKTEGEPTFFQLMFIVDGVKYRYGFEATREEVVSEWLFGKPGEKEVPFFTREGNEMNFNRKQYAEGNRLKTLLSDGSEIVRPNALFLSAAAALNGKTSKLILDALGKITIISGVSDGFMKNAAYKMLEDEGQKAKAVRFLNEAGIAMEDIVVESSSTGQSPEFAGMVREPGVGYGTKKIFAIKKQYDEENDAYLNIARNFEQSESDGTNKMLQLSPFVLGAIEQGHTLIVDEFEARLHTNLAKSIVKLFNRTETNPRNAQFIFSTHDTNLLSPLLTRRDQILFIEKDKTGESRAYNLSDIKGVRNDENYEKNYLIGKYSAVPNIGSLDLALLND